MFSLRDAPIDRKLMLVIMLGSSAALLLAVIGITAAELVTYRQEMARDLTILSEIISRNSTAALVFEDRQAAKGILGALSVQRHILGAAIYDRQHRLFATYRRRGESAPAPELPNGPVPVEPVVAFSATHLDLFRPIELEGEHVGTIFLRSDLTEMRARMERYFLVLLGVLAGSLGAAYLISARMGRLVSDPILDLARAARTISVGEDYTLRVPRHAADEIGELTDAFNEMLAQIQARDHALLEARNVLEARVTERTRELELEIAERRRAEAELRTSEEQLADAERVAHLGSWSWEIGTDRVAWSDELYRVYGLDPTEMTHLDYNLFLDRVHPGDRVAVHDAIVRAGEDLRPFSFRHRIVRPDGSERVLQARGEVIVDEAGQPLRMVGSGQDVTELVLAEEALRRSEAQLRQAQKMEAVGRLAGGVAHDFNNLLTAIIGYSSLLLPRFEDVEGRNEVEEIRKAAERAASLTRQLLAFSRRQMLKPKVVDLDALVADVSRMLGRLIGEDVELVTELGGGTTVIADPGQVEQVIMNLSVNARDAMPQGGELIIRTERLQSAPDPHEGLGPGPWVLLTVRDNGIGMDGETQQRIFEPFFTTKPQGTGLGLATVYGIVTQSGGEIRVASEPGRGTTFRIYLPAAGAPAEEPEPGFVEAVLFGGEGILVVEDDEMLRPLVRDILGRCGYQVFEAGDGEEALRLFAERAAEIALVVTDVIMPRMGGRALAERLQQFDPLVRILFMSGYTDAEGLDAGLESEEVGAFLPKPFTPEMLARKVREVLDR